jgi:xanthine dehydrogenase iron-sulfur cluster and FAD-binding subunit A
MLGRSAPGQAHLAPIESGGHVAALLYADNLPEGSPIGDTTMLSIVLHEAGLVLDRALLERALAEAERAH